VTNLAVHKTEGTRAAAGHRHLSIADSGTARLVSEALPGSAMERLIAMGVPELRRRSVVSWEPPEGEPSLFGLGVALQLRGGPDSDPSSAFDIIRDIALAASMSGVEPSARPRFFGGWRFAPVSRSHADPAWDAFGGWQFIVPAITVAVQDGQWAATTTARADEDSLPVDAAVLLDRLLATDRPVTGRARPQSRRALDAAGWTGAVAEAIAEIGQGDYEKIVLARQVNVELSPGTDAASLRERLRARYPGCWVFGFDAGDSTWLGASPELMVSAAGGEVNAASLAGSRKRGATADEDASLAGELRASIKERHEHALVARAIRDSLSPFCSAIDAPVEPVLLRMHNIQHLYTPVRGRLRNGYDVLDLAAALHPTPAVGGWPRAAALGAIGRLEQMDRGWYAAPFGWVDFDGDGIFAVGLRAGLLTGRELTLYAGNGIVAGSAPDAELAETELKLNSVRAAALEA
jgi:isochorismate synthase